MAKINKDKKKIEDLIKTKELEKVDAEIAKIEEERKKIESEWKEIERKSNLHWYKKPLFIQAVIAGIISFPLIWFYVQDIAIPISSRENIKLSREIEQTKQELYEREIKQKQKDLQQEQKDLQQEQKNRQYKSDIARQIGYLKKLKTEYGSEINSLKKELKEKNIDKIQIAKNRAAEIEKKHSAVSNTIIKQEVNLAKAQHPDGFLTEEIAKQYYLNNEKRPRVYTDNDFEEEDIEGDKIVIDHTTGLMWQQSGSNKFMNYGKAESYIAELNSEKFAGYNDWQLPTLGDAITLLKAEIYSSDKFDDYKLYINDIFSQKQEMIWTSDKANDSRAWAAYLDNGTCCDYFMSDLYFVRAVRLDH